MKTDCLNYLLTEKEQHQFEEEGYLIVEDAIPLTLVEQLTAAVDRVDAEERTAKGLGSS